LRSIGYLDFLIVLTGRHFDGSAPTRVVESR
jgi:hypothetical protein